MEKRGIALVTGASKGIGAAVAVALAEDGYDIWLNYRNDHQSAEIVRKEVEAAGGKCLPLPFDVSDSNAVSDTLTPLLKENAPYILVNNAGFAIDTLMALMGDREWSSVLSVTLDGFFHVTKMVLSGMMRKRKGRIVNIASTSGQSGMPGQVNYSAAKAGLIGATKALALEVAKRNVLVNAVAPGFIETEMTKDLPAEQFMSMIPFGRFGTTREVAGTVRFLCSDQASYITGQTISVNGGTYM